MTDFRLDRWRAADLRDLIRLGRDFDGGYVVSAASVDRADVLVGMGINDDWSFEADFASRRPDALVFGIDGSVSAERFHARARASAAAAIRAGLRLSPADARDALRDTRRWWRTARAFDAFFTSPRRRFAERYLGAQDLTWSAFVKSEIPDGSTVFVKMDIEGAEYEVLPDLIADNARVSGCAIEFHDCGTRWREFASVMDALGEHFLVAHLHGNNWAPLVPGSTLPSVMEVSLVHRSLVEHPVLPAPIERFPVPGLDMPNCPARPEYILPL
jgi:hypothetical protein